MEEKKIEFLVKFNSQQKSDKYTNTLEKNVRNTMTQVLLSVINSISYPTIEMRC